MNNLANWIMIPALVLLPAWYHSLKAPPRLPPGIQTTAARTAAAEEAAVARSAAARAIPARTLLGGAGIAAMVAMLFWPEISDALKKPARQQVDTRKAEQDAFERQARAAQDVTAPEGDEREEPRERARTIRRKPQPRPKFIRYGPNVTACRRGGCPYNGY
jgi:hypothetical protein